MTENVIESGNCFREAYGFLLGCDPFSMPYFPKLYSDDGWFDEFNKWLIEHYGLYAINWGAEEKCTQKLRKKVFISLQACMKGRYVATVIVKATGIHHAVVMEGEKIIFDSGNRAESEYDYFSIDTLHPYITDTYLGIKNE